jgi:DNA primase
MRFPLSRGWQVVPPGMRFSDDFLDEIRARLPVSEVVGRRVKLKKAGREWKGLSPFNKEKTPSFFVNDQKMAWFDFSSGKNGNIFDFVMMTEGLSFPEAVERLAVQAGLPLPKGSREDDQRQQHQRTLYEVLELAAKFFEAALTSTKGAKARGYLSDRGIQPATQLEFRIGYAPVDRFALKEHLGAHGISVATMIEAGLLIAGDDIPVPYDRFRDRIIIPIHDQRGRVIAFGGRALADDVQPKYLNSPETSVFHKGSVVFNFHRARQSAHDNKSVVVVEGYMDAIAIYQAGLKSVVATMGTAFTEAQIATLWRLAPEPVVCFDGDRAGIAAAHRSLDHILPLLKIGRTFRFAFLRGTKDPDELIREKGIEAFRTILTGSLPLWDVLWQREVPDDSVAKTPDTQAALEHKLYGIIRTISDPTVHTAYLRTCRMQLANLFWMVEKSRRSRTELPFQRTELKVPESAHEKLLLGLLVHYPVFIDIKGDEIWTLHFSPRLEEFRAALYDLLVMHSEMSVQIIYGRLKPTFYEVLQDIHGEADGQRQWGFRLMERFPIVKMDPPPGFISRCIDYFVLVLRVRHMEAEVEELIESAGKASDQDEDMSQRLLELIREVQAQRELIRLKDGGLAEDAMEIRRVWGPTEWKDAA